MGVTLKDYAANNIFPTKSYSRPGSYALIEACKMGDILGAKKLLIEDPFLIYDFDHVRARVELILIFRSGLLHSTERRSETNSS